MLIARLVCSDVDCAAEVATEAATLRELETLVCECGCGLALIGWPDHAPDEVIATVVDLRVRGALSKAA